ncbi:MAG: hypothetical protein J5507_01880, partial [Clostridia bacterium]|nr:hypothetical protein [Clostridia bacterium]
FATSSVGELPGGAKWCNEDTEAWSENLNVSPTGNGDWIITTNNNKFYIDKNGSVLDSKPQESVIITAEQIAENGMFIEDAYCFLTISQLSNAEQILNLKNNTTANTNSMGWKYFNKISCSDSSLTNKSNEEFADLDEEDGDYYWIGFTESEDTPMLLIKICKDETFMTDENFQLDSFKNITFSISGSN